MNRNNISIEELVSHFRDYLNSSWMPLMKLLENHDWDSDPYFLDDWLDSNWRLLVVRQLFGNRDVDFQPLMASLNQVRETTWRYRFHVDADNQLAFVKLGAVRDGFSPEPPFDSVLAQDSHGETKIIPLDSARFTLFENSETAASYRN